MKNKMATDIMTCGICHSKNSKIASASFWRAKGLMVDYCFRCKDCGHTWYKRQSYSFPRDNKDKLDVDVLTKP